MKLVRDRLYIGNIRDAAEVLTSPNPPVTHMLSLIMPKDSLECKKPPEEDEENSPLGVVNVAEVQVDKLERKIVPIRDIESQNLLDHLEECLEFIDKGRSDGEILVHCVAGVSRRQEKNHYAFFNLIFMLHSSKKKEMSNIDVL